MGIDLPHLTGLIHYEGERAIHILRDELESLKTQLADARAMLEGLPTPLTIEEIQEQLSATGAFPLQTAGLVDTLPPPTTPPSPPPVSDNIPNYLSIVQSVHTSMGISGTSTDEEMFRSIQQIVADINASGMNPPGIVAGFTLAPPAGSNVFTCLGITYRYARVTFSNGHIFKVYIDADPGGSRTPTWDDNGFDISLYSVATAPGSPC